ncbi:MAG: sedoheptulose 7-phosphate cyclase [Trichodesmium sp. St4_bin8_1]|nr:sedoheptulose 7-phosphate cyclase [Trichodesmium sp. St4_bin8_1]
MSNAISTSVPVIEKVNKPDFVFDPSIRRDHAEQYRTSEWYDGRGEIKAVDDGRSFEISATFTLKSEVKLVNGVLDPSNPILANIYKSRNRCVAVVDHMVDELYGKSLTNYFEQNDIPLKTLVCRAWESDKNTDTVHKILQFLGKDGCDVSRNEPVLIIGGGVLSDVAGLACSLQHRRTPYVMIGTSVVAAIDAGPSPRTCTNSKLFKNGIGAYHPPVMTIVDRTLFRTLAKGHIRNGMAEIIKMAVTDDQTLFELLEKYGRRLVETHFANFDADEELVKISDEVIYRALYSYMKHEGTNMFETYQDRPHAYGHTWSPRFEPVVKLMHGHAVTIGMSLGATLALEMGWITTNERDRIVNLCHSMGLSVYHEIIEDTELMLQAQKNITRKRGRRLWAPLPTGIGSCSFAKEISPDLLTSAVEEHKKFCASFTSFGSQVKGEEMYLSDLGLE